MKKAFVAPTAERAARGSGEVPGSSPGEGAIIPLPRYAYSERLMDRFTRLTDLEFLEILRKAWVLEQSENRWGSAHQAPRYIEKIDKQIAVLTAQETSRV